MSDPSQNYQIKTAWMHSQPARAFHRQGQAWFEALYKSNAVLFGQDVLIPSSSLPQVDTQAEIDIWILANPGLLKKYTDFALTSEAVSNGELWYINDSGWKKPIIQEHLVPKSVTNQPSNGYVIQLKQGVGGSSPGTQISPAEGRWAVLPSLGIFFENGYTPVDMGWGAITVTCYVYIGDTVQQVLTQSTQKIYNCAPTVAVNDVVYGTNFNSVATNTNNTIDIPSLGVVIEKVSSILARVLSYGPCEIILPGLLANKKVFLDTDGTLTNTRPTTGWLQFMGYSYENDTAFIFADFNRIRQNPFT